MKTVATEICGGLGNKLFQIANLLGYCEKHQYSPVLCQNIININKQTTVDWSYFTRGIQQITSSDEQLSGYFQSEKYFKHIEQIIRQQFQCPDDIKTKLLNEFTNLENSYFLHIRRGDYVGNSYHYIDLTSYYNECLNTIDLTNGRTLYVFSDDIPFCKNMFDSFNGFDIRYIERDEITSLWLMSLCNLGGICANSTFSWWGGWLNPNHKKQIFFPSRMFPHNYADSSDLVPEYYTVIDI
jgi:hypothetical protein